MIVASRTNTQKLPRQPPAHRMARRQRRPRRALNAAVAVLAAVGVTGAGIYLLTPSVGDAPSRVGRILAAHHGAVIAVARDTKVARAVVATEDHRFYQDYGIDPIGVARAALGGLDGSGVDQGGATIAQQLAKRLYTPTTNGPQAKLEQVVLAVKLDARYTKNQILSMYLNAIYYGNGYWGIDQAAQGYFHRPADRLTWPQAALLAGLPQAPTAFDPLTHPGPALQRRSEVVGRLEATGQLNAASAATADRAPLLGPGGT